MSTPIPAGKFKAQCLQLLDEVQKSHVPLVISKRGIPVAKLVPYDQEPVNLFGAMKDSVNIKEDILSPLEVKWEANE